jgi:hypothetical protein
MARSRCRGGLVRVLRPVEQVPRLPVLDRRRHRPMRHRIASELVGDQHPRYPALLGQQLTEEPFGGWAVSQRVHEPAAALMCSMMAGHSAVGGPGPLPSGLTACCANMATRMAGAQAKPSRVGEDLRIAGTRRIRDDAQ